MIIAILGVGIGYAVLTQNLNISGTANISSSWDILFTTITEGTLTNAKTISKSITDGTSLTLNVELNQPGASATYNVTVSNRGSFDATLASISDVEEGNNANPKSIQYSVEGITAGDSLLSNTEQTFQVIVTWDKNIDISSDHMEKEIKVTLNYEQRTEVPTPTPVTKTGIELLTSKNVLGNADGLFSDNYGNIRYRGSKAEVKNNVTFNGENWNIIGVVNGNLKLIKTEPYTKSTWGYSNNWNNSQLRYSFSSYFSSLNSVSQGLVENKYFRVSAIPDLNGHMASMIYNEEESSGTCSGCPIMYQQNVGLMSPSDYGYAARSSCRQELAQYHADANCSTEGNWLYLNKGYDSESTQWLMNPYSGNTTGGTVVTGTGEVKTNVPVTSSYQIRPVIYLKTSVLITNGDGTLENPYILSM